MKNYTLGQLIRSYREKKGLTQEELADIIHVTKGKLTHWENDETIPRPTMVARLIGALRIPEIEASFLIAAVEDAETTKAQQLADPQAIIDEQNNEDERLKHKHKGPLREFCVSDFRQNQEYHVFNVHDGGLFPLVTSLPEGWDGMRADTA